MMVRVLIVAVAGALALSAAPSYGQSQPNSRQNAQPRSPQGTVVYSRDEQGRVRTKVLVQKRSYLDGGTEVLPSDNINPARSSFMNQAPAAALRNTAADREWAISNPNFLPGISTRY